MMIIMIHDDQNGDGDDDDENSERKIVTCVLCRLALLEVRGTSRSGYSNCKQCGNDDDHHHYDHDGDQYDHDYHNDGDDKSMKNLRAS